MAVHWGKLLVGLATGYISITALRDAFGRSDAALKKLEAGMPCPGDGSIPCKMYPAGTIESRAKRIAGLIKKGSLDPRVRRLAVRSVSKRCDGEKFCTPSRDALGELSAIFGDLKNPSSELAKEVQSLDGVLASVKRMVRYTGDARLSDQFQSAPRTLFDFHGGDCDDFTIALGSLYMALGYAEQLRIYTLKGQSEPGHIALRVSPDKHGAKYVTVDGSVDVVKVKGKKAPVFVGWDAATHTGLVSSFKDYPV